MVNVEIDARILEDKKFNTQVENIITETREARRNVQIGGAQLKSSPVIRLMDEGNLSLSFILSEFPKIANKESQLSRGQRDVVANIVFEAARRVVFLNQQERARKAAKRLTKKRREMTFEEMKAIANKTTTRKKSRHIESQIQQSCVKWFRLQFPEIGLLLFAVPNGGARNKREAGILKGEGVTAGVADMILLKPSGGFASLCIEFKTEEKGSTQRETQKQWQKAAEAAGNKYVICRSFDDFRKEVISYLFPKK